MKRIDTSMLPYGVPRRIVDKAYRQSARDRACEVCGSFGTTVLAHIAITGNSGVGLKPSDDHSLFLCGPCHAGLDTDPDRCEWLVQKVLLPIRESAYREWKNGR